MKARRHEAVKKMMERSGKWMREEERRIRCGYIKIWRFIKQKWVHKAIVSSLSCLSL